jgi:hypothetical protein
MTDILNLIFNNIQSIAGLITLFFALVISIIKIFVENTNNEKNKIICIIFVTSLILFSNNQWTYLLGLVIIGTIVTGTKFMLEFVKWIKTTRTENRTENNNENITLLKIENKAPNIEK